MVEIEGVLESVKFKNATNAFFKICQTFVSIELFQIKSILMFAVLF